MASREDYIYYARLAEQGERYEDMIKYMKIVSEVSKLANLGPASPLAPNAIRNKDLRRYSQWTCHEFWNLKASQHFYRIQTNICSSDSIVRTTEHWREEFALSRLQKLCRIQTCCMEDDFSYLKQGGVQGIEAHWIDQVVPQTDWNRA